MPPRLSSRSDVSTAKECMSGHGENGTEMTYHIIVVVCDSHLPPELAGKENCLHLLILLEHPGGMHGCLAAQCVIMFLAQTSCLIKRSSD